MLENALQAEKQDTEQRSKQRRWRPGQSGNPCGRESKASRLARREAIIARWAEPFGGIAALKPAELDLLHQAAELSLMRPRTVEDQVRVANTISKIMAQVGFVDKRRHLEPAEASALTFADIAAQAQADASNRRARELAADAVQEEDGAKSTPMPGRLFEPRVGDRIEVDQGTIEAVADPDDDPPEPSR